MRPRSSAARRSGRWACAIRGGSASTASTGDLYIGDVGQDATEEIDFIAAEQRGGRELRLAHLGGQRSARRLGAVSAGSATHTRCPILDLRPRPGLLGHRRRRVPRPGRARAATAVISTPISARGACGPLSRERGRRAGRTRSAARDAAIRSPRSAKTATARSTGRTCEAATIHRLVADPAAPLAIEYYHAELGHYFTDRPFRRRPRRSMRERSHGRGGERGFAFAVARPAMAAPVDVCRFFGTPNVGPNTHFFTGQRGRSAAALKAADPAVDVRGISFRHRACPLERCMPGATAAGLSPVQQSREAVRGQSPLHDRRRDLRRDARERVDRRGRRRSVRD